MQYSLFELHVQYLIALTAFVLIFIKHLFYMYFRDQCLSVCCCRFRLVDFGLAQLEPGKSTDNNSKEMFCY